METRQRIEEAYIDHLREHGRPPVSVFRFCKDLEVEERDFFSEFPHFDAVESSFWGRLVDRVAEAASVREGWDGYNARQKFLSFLYLFQEELLAYRSLFLLRFHGKPSMMTPPNLKGLEDGFRAFVKPVLDAGRENGEIAKRGRLDKLQAGGLYLHLRSVIDFALKDDSKGYERTDAYIEKSTSVVFDALATQTLDSALDLVRFLLPAMKGSGKAPARKEPATAS